MKKFFLIFSFLLLVPGPWSLVPSPLLAQPTQFYLEDTISEGTAVRIYVVGEAKAKDQIQESLYAAVDHAREALAKLQKELNEMNQKKMKGNFMVSAELAKAIDAGLEISKKTDGLFDITGGQGNFRKIKVDSKNNSLKIGENNIQIDVTPLKNGFLADLVADDLAKAGWNNCLVKMGSVYVTRGNDANAPWKIPVVVPSEKIAKRVLYYKTKKAQAAGATWSLPPEEGTSSNLKSVTVFSQSGAEAQGLASTISRMGFEEGKKFLAKNKSLGAILIDAQGNLTNVP